jgi:MtrB/PioB family decaheme-associated outer membrane protein
MKNSRQLLLVGVLSAFPAVAAAAEGADTSQWKCEACKFQDGMTGAVELGLGTVSDKSAKFGEYNGLQSNGEFFIVDGTVRNKGPDGAYWNLDASNLGLGTRSINLEGGVQGNYKLNLGYQELRHFQSDSALTPYQSGGTGSTLNLPSGFTRGATTAAMPLANLSPTNVGTKRKRVDGGFTWMPSPGWEYSVNVRQEVKEGNKRGSGAFTLNATQFLLPIDQTTDQIDASASYNSGPWFAKFSYYASMFRNNINAVSFQNPFSQVVAGDSTGQLAAAPANQFHQIRASGGLQLGNRTQVTGEIAFGRMLQDDAFLRNTTNTATAGLLQGLPRNSLEASASVVNSNIRATSALSSRLRLNAAYVHDSLRDNTPQSIYPVVTTDQAVGLQRANLPYGYKRDKFSVSADYRLLERTRVSAGLDLDNNTRDYQAAKKTEEGTVWGKVGSQVTDKIDLSFKAAHADRKSKDYQLVPAIVPGDNPLMRKFYLASRVRDIVGVRTDISATDTLSFGLGLDVARDAYTESVIGLNNGKDTNLNGDATLKVSEDTDVRLFAAHQEIKSRQSGSQAFSVPDWTADSRDRITTYGVGLQHALIKSTLDVGADYSTSLSRSEIAMNTGGPSNLFPERRGSLSSMKVYATYRVKENVSVNASYWHELYASQNWAIDGVAPNTIPNVLTLGQQSPRYNLHVVRVSMRYAF